MDKQKGLAEKSFFVWAGIIASLIAIYVFISGNQDIHDELDSYFSVEQPTAFPTPTLVTLPDTITLSFYFYWINHTGSKGNQWDDSILLSAWEETTVDFRCKEFGGCDYETFRDYWLNWKVQGTLYECGSSVVDAELIYYPKDEASGLQTIGPFFRRYILVEESGVQKINEAVDIQGPCIFYESKTAVTP